MVKPDVKNKSFLKVYPLTHHILLGCTGFIYPSKFVRQRYCNTYLLYVQSYDVQSSQAPCYVTQVRKHSVDLTVINYYMTQAMRLCPCYQCYFCLLKASTSAPQTSSDNLEKNFLHKKFPTALNAAIYKMINIYVYCVYSLIAISLMMILHSYTHLWYSSTLECVICAYSGLNPLLVIIWSQVLLRCVIYNKKGSYFYYKSIVGCSSHLHSFSDLNSNNNSNTDHDKLVVNLSDTTITQSEKRLLARGLKFCPNPGEPDFRLFKDDLDSFHLKLKREIYFKEVERVINSDDEDEEEIIIPNTPRFDPDKPFSDRKFKLPSDWIPPVLAPLEYFIQQNELALNRSKLPKFNGENITAEEKVSIKKLLSNKDITVKPADKGGAVVVMNTTDYINEGLRQLSDDKFYIETNIDLTDTHSKIINKKIADMYEDKEIDLKCHDYLMSSTGRTSLFYMLPKIHKKLVNPPGRPIVSGNGCPTEMISQLVDHFLQPHVKRLPSYIKDTTHFLQKLQNIDKLPEGTLLATLDVASLYTNIPNDEG